MPSLGLVSPCVVNSWCHPHEPPPIPDHTEPLVMFLKLNAVVFKYFINYFKNYKQQLLVNSSLAQKLLFTINVFFLHKTGQKLIKSPANTTKHTQN